MQHSSPSTDSKDDYLGPQLIGAVIGLIVLSWLIYQAFFTEVHYLVLSDKYRQEVPEYLRAADASSQQECLESALYWKKGGADTVYCEPIPTWRHWSNIARNLAYQAELLAQ